MKYRLLGGRSWRCRYFLRRDALSIQGQDVDPKEVPRANQVNLEACIHRALELGINHIETARAYGTSEMQLGNVLPKLPRDKSSSRPRCRRKRRRGISLNG